MLTCGSRPRFTVFWMALTLGAFAGTSVLPGASLWRFDAHHPELAIPSSDISVLEPTLTTPLAPSAPPHMTLPSASMDSKKGGVIDKAKYRRYLSGCTRTPKVSSTPRKPGHGPDKVEVDVKPRGSDDKILAHLHESIHARFPPMVTLDTRKLNTTVPLPGVPGLDAYNLMSACGQRSWKNIATKTCSNLAYVELVMSIDPTQLVVLLDGSDLVYTGCSKNDLHAAYTSLVAHSGASIVFGAEFGCWPCKVDDEVMVGYSKNSQRSRRRVALERHGLEATAYTDHAKCEIPYGPCSAPPAMQYLNGGFAMGPAQDLQPVLQDACEHVTVASKEAEAQRRNASSAGKASKPLISEQRFLHRYLLEHPDAITLDYPGHLVINLHQLDTDLKFFSVEERMDGNLKVRVLRNRVTGRVQCFVHGNGSGKDVVKKLAKRLEM